MIINNARVNETADAKVYETNTEKGQINTLNSKESSVKTNQFLSQNSIANYESQNKSFTK